MRRFRLNSRITIEVDLVDGFSMWQWTARFTITDETGLVVEQGSSHGNTPREVVRRLRLPIMKALRPGLQQAHERFSSEGLRFDAIKIHFASVEAELADRR